MKIELVQESHLENLISFFAKFENEHRSKKFWAKRLKNWWNDNPSFGTNFKKGWILVNESESIVGFIGNIPTNYIVNGEKKIVNNTTSWRVLKEYRSQSILLFQEIIKSSASTILFDTTPTPTVEKILKLYKFQKNNYTRETIFPTTLKNDALRSISKIFFLSAYSSFLDPFLQFFYHIKLFSTETTIKAKIISNEKIDEKIDLLWEKTQNKFSTTLVRDSDNIRWYLKNELNIKKIFIGCFSNNEIIGYSIFSCDYSKNIMLMLDFWFEKDEDVLLKKISLRALKFAKNKGIKRIIYPHFNPLLEKSLSSLSPFNKEIDSKIYYKTEQNDFLSDNNTYITLISGDYGL